MKFLQNNKGEWNWSRRRLLGSAGASAIVLPGLSAGAAQNSNGGDARPPLNRYPRMVHEYFVAQVRFAERRKLRLMSQLQSREDAEVYVESVRKRIRACFGPEPERTPLNPRVTGIVQRDGFQIEKVIFDSRPGFPVTANLYLPTPDAGKGEAGKGDSGKGGKFPGVVGTCGHSANGKAAGAYQSFAQGLAKLGFACLIYDPIGQGERLQYVNEDLSPRIGTGTREHLHAGNQQFLVGEFLGMWRAWDGIRALDYLLTREEVDSEHLGVTGNSGGGTMTTWLCGVERRWTMGAPSCFVTTFRRNMENELPADTEQCPPRALALNLDHDDFLAAMAPRPVIVLAKEQDFFDVRGSEEAYRRLKRLYGLLGAEQNVDLFIGPTTHGYTQENREAMYGWFGRAAKGGREPVAEPAITIEDDETLWCTPNGQVAELEGTRTAFGFTRDKSRELAEQRGDVRGEALRNAVRRSLASASAGPCRAGLPHLALPWFARLSGAACHFLFGGDRAGDVRHRLHADAGTLVLATPAKRSAKRAVLYVAHHSSDQELRDEPLIGELLDAEPDALFFTCDVRGIGESRPDTCGADSFLSPYGSDYFYAIHGLMLDRPYLGQKTFDLLRVLDWLRDIGRTDVHLVGRGWGALPATFAALLSDQVTQLTLKNALTSYTDVAETEDYTWPLSSLLPNVLAHFDLPDCYRELKSRKLRQIEPRVGSASQS